MSEQDVATIETQLNKVLPNSYRNLLLNYPTELIGLGSPANDVDGYSLKNNAKEIIELNKFIPGLPDFYICIGEDGCGNFFLINLKNEAIYFLDHEKVVYIDEPTLIDFKKSIEFTHKNLSYFVAHLKALFSN